MTALWGEPIPYTEGEQQEITATYEDIKSAWGEIPNADLTIPGTQRTRAAEIMKGEEPGVWIPFHIDGKTSGVELWTSRAGALYAYVWYEDSPENWEGNESEITAYEGTYDAETGNIEFV